ncbi:uncharacterized protein CCR75_008850 [Bremia lactucae]|uniref:FHA domain-containing protein n=1 Tax=Bremia lactucae TaxID=4779 RepID=A0A976FDH9_BRELC|nr:hypothetical protein CCR75_008850 [Bremia lactucae]
MWVLDAESSDGNLKTTFYLAAGEWSVGRKNCHFSFYADLSISRVHALIRVGALSSKQLEDPSTRPTLELVDKNSRFGSFVNQQQIIGTRSLQHGDEISFGAKTTVLRLRYQIFILVASRIRRANRAKLNDACQCLGMHIIAMESKNATHCIMDPGHVVATIKMLWALVYNQPVVCTPWIYAILNRSNLSEPLPRCEDFLPANSSAPSKESNYLPNPLRKTLFEGYGVVFFTPQLIQEIIAAMGGVVIAAYEDPREISDFLRQLALLAKHKRLLLVDSSQESGFSGIGGQNKQRSKATVDSPCFAENADQRAKFLLSIGGIFTSVQELAASVILVKPPSTSNSPSFSSSLASYADSQVQNIIAWHEGNHKGANVKSKQMKIVEDTVGTCKKSSEQITGPHNDTVKVHMSKDGKGNLCKTRIPDESQEVALVSRESELVMPIRKRNDELASSWKSSCDLQSRDVKLEADDIRKPIVVSCSLIVKRSEPDQSNKKDRSGLENFKRFKKGNGCGSGSSTTSLFPQRTIISIVDNAECKALQESLEVMEAQERIAEELFAMGEGRISTKLF